MVQVDPYSLEQAQELVEDALTRSKTRHGKWNALEHLYRTGHYDEGMEAADVPPRLWDDIPGLTLDGINLVLPHMNIIRATAMERDPGFVVEPYTGGEDAEHQAYVGQELLSYWWKRTRATQIHRDMTQDMVVLGCGFAKVGWAFAEEERELDEDEIAEELDALIEADRRDAKLDKRPPKHEDELASLVEGVSSEVARDEPFVEYVSPYDIFVPPTARRLSEARWVAQRLTLPYDEVAANPAYDQDAVDALKPADALDRAERRSDDERIQEGSGEESPFAEVTLYEFYDMRSRRMMVFQLDTDKPLYGVEEGVEQVGDELPYGHRHPPFVMMRNFEDGGTRFWPFGDVENIAAIQHEFNEYVYEQMDNARRSGNKYVIDEEFYTSDVKEALESDESDVVVPVKLGNRNIGDIIQAIEREGLDADVYQAKAELAGRMKEVLGLNEFQAGGSGSDRMTATTAAVIDGTATLRAADKKMQVEEATSHTGLLLLLLNQEYLTEDRAIRIVQADGTPQWLDVSADDLVGEYGVSVESGSTQAVNPATRQARALELMTQIIPALSEDGYDTHPLWRKAIRDYGMDPNRVLKRAPQPPQEPGGGQGQGQALEGELPDLGGSEPTVPGEDLGGPPVPAATAGDTNL